MKTHTTNSNRQAAMKNTRKPNRILTTSIAALLGVAIFGLSPAAKADQYWDGAGLVANGIIDGGAGSWNNVTTNWTNATGTVNAAFANANGTARFLAPFAGGAGPFIVTVDSVINLSGLTMAIDGGNYTFNTGVAGSAFNVAAAGATITVASPLSTTINAQIINAGALTVGNAGITGTLILTNTANTYSGGTTLTGTTTLLNNAATSALGTGPVTINGPGSTFGTTSGAAVTISNDIVVGANFNLTSTNALTLTNLNLTGARTITSTGGGAKTINGTISGVGSVTYESTGGGLSFIYGPAEKATYTGATTVQNGGTLFLNSLNTDAAIIGNVVVNNGGVIVVNANNQIADTSTVTVNTGGLFTLAGGFQETIKTLNSGANGGEVRILGGTLTVADGDFSGTITDVVPGSLRKNGPVASILKLSGNNIYTGTTNIDSGTILAGSTTALSSGSAFVLGTTGSTLDLGGFNNTIKSLAGGLGSVVQNSTATNAVLTFGDGSAQTFAGNIINGAGGTLGITKQGAGIETLSGVNTYGGITTIKAGGITAGSTAALSANSAFLVQTGATLSLNGFNNTIASLSDGGTTGGTVNNGAAGPATLTFGDATSTIFKGLIVDGGAGKLSLIKQGAGTTTLGGANTYTGTTTINAGVLKGGIVNAFGTLSAVTVNAAGTMDLGGFDQTIGSLAGVAGAIVINSSVDPKILTTGGDNTSTEFAGVLKDGAPNGILSLTKVGTGIFKLSGVNTYTGATTITGGTLQMGVPSALSTATAVTVTTPAIFDLNNFGQNIGSLAGTGNVLLGTATLTTGNDNTATNYSGVMSGTGALRKVGTAIFTISGAAANTFSGGTAVNDGTLLLSKTAGVNAIGTGPVTVGDGAGAPLSAILQLGASNQIADVSALTLLSDGKFDLNNFLETVGSVAGASPTSQINLGTGTLTTGDATSTTFAGNIVSPGGGSIVKQGTGTWTLSGINTYSGTTTVNAGILKAGSTTGFAQFSAFTVNANSTLDLAGNSSSIGSLAGVGPLSFVQSTGGAATLTTGFDNTSTTYGGIIQNGVGGVLTLTKVGTGTQILTGANTYTGLTTVTTGVLEAGNNSALGAPALGTTVALGATLRLQNGIAITGEPLTITGAGSGAAGAQGALTVVAGATASYLGPITAVGTVLGLNAPTIHANGGTLTLGTINKSDADLILTGGGTINVNGAITGNLIGFNDDLIVDSTTVNLNAANSYVGNTFIRSTTLPGTLNANAVDALPNSTNANIDLRTRLTMGDLTSTAAATTLNLNNGFAQSVQTLISPNTVPGRNAVVNLNAATSTLTIGNTNVADSQSFFGVIAGSGGITKDGASTQILAGPLSAANTYAGLTTVAAGILEAGKNGALGSTAAGTTVANGATLRLQNLVIIPVGEALTIAGAGTGAANAKGALTVVAGATASYLGPITVAPGTSATINANAGILTLGTIDKTDATLTLNGGGTINANGAITGNLIGYNDDLIVDSTTVNLNAANSYVGPTFIRSTLASGTLNANVLNALPNSTSANIDLRTRLTMGDATSTVAPTTLNLNGGFAQSIQTLISPNTAPGLNAVVNLNTSTLTIGNTNAADSQSFFGTITGTGGIIKDGASTQIFAKNNTYTGPTTITNGTLQIDGASASAVTVQTPAVGTQSTLAGSGNINAPVTIQSGGILDPGPVGTLAGTLTTGPLTLNGLPGSVASPANDSILNYDFGQAGVVGGALNDLTNVTNGAGTLVLNGVINVTQTTGGAFTAGAYRIFNYLAPIGNLTDGGLAIGALPNGFSAANTIVDTSVAGQVNLIALPIGPGFPPLVQYWDGPGLVGNGLIDGGSGTWNNFLTNWTTANGAVNSSWQSGIAVFGGDLTAPGGVQAATGGTATITDRIFVSGIKFDPTVDGATYTIAATVNPGTPPAPAFGLYLLGAVTIDTNTGAGVISRISAPIFNSGVGVAAIGSITKIGAGDLALSAQNTYTGGTTLNAGTLDIDASSIAVGAIPSVNPVLSGPIGTGQLTINGGIIGTTTTTGANNAIGNAVQVNANFAVSGPGTGDGVDFAGSVTLNQAGATVITTNSGFLDFSGTIADAFAPGGGLTLVGGTSLIGSSTIGGVPAILGQVDASNTYAGLTTITGGALVFLAKNSGAVAIPGNLQIDAGATVRLDSFPPNVAGLGTTTNQIATTSNVLVNGALDLSGINQAINGLTGNGTVQLDDANGAGVGGASVFTVNNGNFGGSIFDNGKGGQLVKNTGGTLILTGNNPYVGNTTINKGNLQVDGFIGSKNTFVNFGGTLSGTGVIGGNVINGGLVSPGHSPGTLTVKGNYTQTPAGTLLIEVAGKGAGQHDLLAVGGAANLNGTLRIANVGSVRLHRGDKITFLTAGGGVNGQFATVNSDPFLTTGHLLKAEVVYKPNLVQLAAVQGSFARDIDGLTPNQKAVARNLDRVVGDHRADKLIDFLDGEPLGNLRHDLDLIAPEELASIFNIGVSLANVQSMNLLRRMDDIQAGAAGFSASGYAMSGGPSYSGGSTAYGARGPEGKGGKELRAPEENRWGVFVTGVGEFTNIGNTSNARGYDLTTGGFTIGVDYKVTPNFAIGINTGYARTGADLTGNGRVTVDGAKLGLYATYFTGTGFYADAAVNGGYNSYDTRRSALRGSARGSTEGGEINALFATGYDWKTGGLRIGPTASVQYTNVSINGFREHGSLAPLKFTDQSGESLRTALGMKASYDIQAGGVVIRPEVRAAWQHEFGDSSFAIDSRFANGAGNTFTVHGPEIGDDSLLLGAGVAVLWNERTSTYVYYDGELGRTNYRSNNVSGGVRLSF